MLARYLVGFVLALVALYGVVEAYPLLAGPYVSIQSPLNGETATSSVVIVSGVALRTTTLTLDGAPLYPTQSGRFSTTLAFPSGTSILTIAGTDRFGRTISKTRTIVVP